MKVAVVGAGAMGAAVALELFERGAEVTLVEADRPGSGTSSRGAGLVSESMWHPTSLRLVTRSIEILQRISREGEERGHPFRFHQTGSTTLLPPQAVAVARELAAMQRGEGAQVRDMAAEDLLALPRHEGMHIDDVAHALHYPRDGWAMPRLFSEIMAHTLRLSGGRVVKGAARLLPEGQGVEVDGERIATDAVVVACGIWTRRVLQMGGLDAPIQAYRTQAMRFADARAPTVPMLHDNVQGFYLRPGVAHDLVAGNGTTTHPEDLDKWESEADPSFVEKTLRRLRHRFPYLSDSGHVDAWAGIEAATPDRLLLAGPHPRAPSVWLLAGGNGFGFMRAPAAAESLAQSILGKTPTVDMAPYDPARFAGKAPDFVIKEGFSIEKPA